MRLGLRSGFHRSLVIGVICALFLALYIVSRSNYLLFHVCVEIYAIIICFFISILTTNRHEADQNGYFTVVGVSFAGLGALTILHMAAYKGMGVFPTWGTNEAAQLWIASRYVHAVMLLAGLAFAGKRASQRVVIPVVVGVCLILVLSIGVWRIFPVCYVEGVGLTMFKKVSEYIIIGLLALKAFFLLRMRSRFPAAIIPRLLLSIVLLVFAEFAFTLYRDITGTANLLGHLLIAASFTFTYAAFVDVVLRNPFDILFGSLEASEQRYRGLFENSPLPMWEEDWSSVHQLVVDWRREGVTSIGAFLMEHRIQVQRVISAIRFTNVNPAMLSLKGMDRSHFIDEGINGMVSGTTQEAIVQEVTAFAEGNYQVEHRATIPNTPSGERRGSLSAVLLPEEHLSWRRVLIAFTDTTKLMAVMRENERVKIEVMQAQKMESLGALAAGIAHDFNNLLTSINGFSELLGADLPGDSPLQDNVAGIRKAAATAASMTRQLLAFSRRQPLRLVSVDLDSLIVGLGPVLSRLLGEKISLAVVPDPMASSIPADPSQLEQALMNLLVNARDAMPDGGTITIRTGRRTVTVEDATTIPSCPAPGSYAWFTVSDTGSGIPPEFVLHVFEPFFTTKGQGKGTGLGLSVVQSIAQGHGGWASVSSHVGAGSTFTVFLRVDRTPLAQDTAALEQATAPLMPKPRGTVLIVDDDSGVLAFVERALTGMGYATLSAGSVQEATALFARHMVDIRLVISDFALPDQTGVDLAKSLWQISPDLPIALMTGYLGWSVEVDISKRLRGVLEKPFTLNQLQELVASALTESSLRV
jgi:signal transduction histidine kinase/CheY-like chemotaxis protein